MAKKVTYMYFQFSFYANCMFSNSETRAPHSVVNGLGPRRFWSTPNGFGGALQGCRAYISWNEDERLTCAAVMHYRLERTSTVSVPNSFQWWTGYLALHLSSNWTLNTNREDARRGMQCLCDAVYYSIVQQFPISFRIQHPYWRKDMSTASTRRLLPTFISTIFLQVRPSSFVIVS